jgi:hypothetical protein
MMHLIAALPSVPIHCGANQLIDDAWWVLKGLITLACLGFILWTGVTSKPKWSFLPLIGALAISGIVFYSTVLGGVFTLGNSAQQTLTSAGFNAQPTDFGAPTGC